MQIEEHQQAAVSVISPRGPIAGDDATEVLSRVRSAASASAGRVVLDLAMVPYFDSRGLETVADLGEDMARSARQIKVAAANETVREVFDITGIDAWCEHFSDVSSAVRSFS